MNERREKERGKIKSTIPVIDTEEGTTIGTLVDISPSGMRINGKTVIDVGRKMELLLKLPKNIFGKKNIDTTVQCIWSNIDADTQYYLSGFEFIEVSQEDSNTIIGLIMEEKALK